MKNLLLTQFDLHQRLFNNVLDGFSEEESNQRLNNDTRVNHVKYISGHLLDSQQGLALLAGLDPVIRWHDLFAGMGESEARDDFPYPSMIEIKQEWNALYRPLRYALEALSIEKLAEKPPAPFDSVANSKGEFWAFINHHMAYHIGQIGILRKALGKEPMRYD